MNSVDYVEVYDANGQLEADMIRLMLEASGLHVITRQESAGAVYGLTVGPLGVVRILVPETEVTDAKNLLTAMEEGKLVSDLPLDGESELEEDDDVD